MRWGGSLALLPFSWAYRPAGGGSLRSLESGTVILEMKDGRYEGMGDVMEG